MQPPKDVALFDTLLLPKSSELRGKNRMKLRTLGFSLVLLLSFSGLSFSQAWTPLKNKPSFSPGTSLLLTDGTVMVQDENTYSNWWKLTPDDTGSYANGTWTQLASLPSGYGPLYFASAVLVDGRVIVEGGEYNFGSSAWTNLGAIYDPTKNKWTKMSPPSGWANIGDAQSVILNNGQFVLANCCEGSPYPVAYLNPSKLTWTQVGSGKTDRYDEEGWELLPDGTVLTVDAINAPAAEKFIPGTKKWISAGDTVGRLEDPSSQEIGPAVLRPNRTVFATGADVSGVGHTSIYHIPAVKTDAGKWTKGPDFPNGDDCEDAPAALLITGNVLVQASPGVYSPPSHFYEFNGTTLTAVTAPSGASSDPSYAGRMLELPTGQIWWDDGASVQLYTPSGTFNSSWQPVITSSPSSISTGQSYPITGTLFNGLSQGGMYGDDSQQATNYPLVQIINTSSGHIFYARTHNHTYMGVNNPKKSVTTTFDVPSNVPSGAAQLVVVTNGIPSNPVAVTVN